MNRRTFMASLGAFTACSALAQAEKTFDIALADGKTGAEQETLRVTKGDKVVLRWKSDRQIALHLHGYDIETTVPAQGTTTMSFTASLPGRFPVSEHAHGPGHHRAVLYLEVRP